VSTYAIGDISKNTTTYDIDRRALPFGDCTWGTPESRRGMPWRIATNRQGKRTYRKSEADDNHHMQDRAMAKMSALKKALGQDRRKKEIKRNKKQVL